MINIRGIYRNKSIGSIKEETLHVDHTLLKTMPQMNFFKYSNNKNKLPPSPKLSAYTDPDPLIEDNIKDTTPLHIVSNYGYLASRSSKGRVYAKYNLFSNRGLLIRKELRDDCKSIRMIASNLGLSQMTVRDFVREMYLQGFFKNSVIL